MIEPDDLDATRVVKKGNQSENPREDLDETRLIPRRENTDLDDDEKTRVISRHVVEDEKTRVISRSRSEDDKTRVISRRSEESLDQDQTTLSPNRVRKNPKGISSATQGKAKLPDVPVGQSQEFTKPPLVVAEIARTDFGTPTKQRSANSPSPHARASVSQREKSRSLKLALFLVLGFAAAVGIITLILTFS